MGCSCILGSQSGRQRWKGMVECVPVLLMHSSAVLGSCLTRGLAPEVNMRVSSVVRTSLESLSLTLPLSTCDFVHITHTVNTCLNAQYME